MVKIVLVDVEIIGLTEIVENKIIRNRQNISPPSTVLRAARAR